ncbi:hypothetical protein CD798_12495 [Bacillaceae bacterium SAOS 7]|nr:hypothetical protein CD798_12495 [Bacillaceae bacterium SAOS 7]
MAPGFPIFIGDIKIRTSEALYQACRFPHLPDVQRAIIREASPMTAKMKSKPHCRHSRADWDDVRIKIMRWCLRIKLFQNWTTFAVELERTEDFPIVEESHKDSFWGAIPDEDNHLYGTNALGRLLMELREEARNIHEESVVINTPNLEQFLLFGEPIPRITCRLKQQPSVVKSKSEKSDIEQIFLFEE